MNLTFLSPIEEVLVEPVKYYYNMNGKNIRKKICTVLGKKFNIPLEDIENINNLLNVLHNASLVIDDIQDNSVLRRNKECAHNVYGIPLSLNAGYLTVFKILHEINKNDSITNNLKHKITENIYLSHIGQGMDIYYTKNKIIPTLDEYYKMIHYKTGMIFLTMVDLLQEKNNEINYPKFYEIFLKFSYFYQIRDDYINLTDVDYWKEKGFCQDIDEQKISFLITFAYNNKLKKYKKILELLKAKEKRKLVLLFYKNGLFDQIYNLLDNLKKEIILLSENHLSFIFDDLVIKPFDVHSFELFLTNDTCLNSFASRPHK